MRFGLFSLLRVEQLASFYRLHDVTASSPWCRPATPALVSISSCITVPETVFNPGLCLQDDDRYRQLKLQWQWLCSMQSRSRKRRLEEQLSARGARSHADTVYTNLKHLVVAQAATSCGADATGSGGAITPHCRARRQLQRAQRHSGKLRSFGHALFHHCACH